MAGFVVYAYDHQLLTGTLQGNYLVPRRGSDIGTTFKLTGSGTIAFVYGPHTDVLVQVSGELHTPGFVPQGYTTGYLTLSNNDGSIVLQLQGPEQPGFSMPPPTFAFAFHHATGRYVRMTGQGCIALRGCPETNV